MSSKLVYPASPCFSFGKK